MNEFYGTNFPLYFFISDFVHIPFLLRKRSLNLLQEKKRDVFINRSRRHVNTKHVISHTDKHYSEKSSSFIFRSNNSKCFR